jgi:hypothetical protein
MLRNEALAHELILNPDFQLPVPAVPRDALLLTDADAAMSDAAADGAHRFGADEASLRNDGGAASASARGGRSADMERRFREAMEKAYWDRLKADARRGDFALVARLIKELRQSLKSLTGGKSAASRKMHEALDEGLDAAWLERRLEHGAFDVAAFRRMLGFLVNTVLRLEAPSSNAETKAWHARVDARLAAGCGDAGSRDPVARAGGDPPQSDPPQSAPPAVPAPAEPEAVDPAAPVRELKALVARAGLSAADCVSKADLVERARAAAARLAARSPGDAGSPAVAGAADFDREGVLELLPTVFKFLHVRVEQIRVGTSNFHLKMLGAHLASGTEAADFERRRFAALLVRGEATVDRAAAWIERCVRAESVRAPDVDLRRAARGAGRQPLRLRLLRAGLPRLLTDPKPLGVGAPGPAPRPSPACPETFRLDLARLVGAQNRLQALTLQATFCVILAQALSRQRVAAPRARAAVERMSRRVGVILEGAARGEGGVRVEHLEAEVLQTAADCLAGRGASGAEPEAAGAAGTTPAAGSHAAEARALPEAEASLLRGLVDKATSLEHPIYKMLTKRIVAALALWLEGRWESRAAAGGVAAAAVREGGGQGRGARLAPDGLRLGGADDTAFDAHVARFGLAAVRDEIAALGAVLLPVLRHNERVHADLYDRLILAAVDKLPEHKAPPAKVADAGPEDEDTSDDGYSSYEDSEDEL